MRQGGSRSESSQLFCGLSDILGTQQTSIWRRSGRYILEDAKLFGGWGSVSLFNGIDSVVNCSFYFQDPSPRTISLRVWQRPMGSELCLDMDNLCTVHSRRFFSITRFGSSRSSEWFWFSFRVVVDFGYHDFWVYRGRNHKVGVADQITEKEAPSSFN